MLLAVILRRLFLISLLALPQVYWLGRAWRLTGQSRFGRTGLWIGRVLIVMAIGAMAADLYDRISVRFLPEAVSYAIAPAVQLWIFSSTFAFFLTKGLHGGVWCLTRIAALFREPVARTPDDFSRRDVLHRLASVAATAPFWAAAYGYSFERLHFEVERVEVPIASLPPALDGLRIMQISDIHAGDFMTKRDIRRAIGMANELEPQLAVITGDFISSRGDPLEGCICEIARLLAPLGAWGCNGNHEIYAGAEDEAAALFAKFGMRLLRSSAAQLKWNGASLNLIGIDYQRVPFNGRSIPTLGGAETLVRRDLPNILLSHNPNTFYSAAAAGVELSLAGHTHGGQVSVEILHRELNPARFLTSFVAGLYNLPMKGSNPATSMQAQLYVNRGLGTLGFPARIGSRPEITLLTLRTARPS
jgi:hypothetical protein